HPARSTPLGPKVDEHRHLSLLHNLIEVRLIDFERRVACRQLGFASSAVPHFVQMVRRNPVLLATGRANSNHGSLFGLEIKTSAQRGSLSWAMGVNGLTSLGNLTINARSSSARSRADCGVSHLRRRPNIGVLRCTQ